MLVVRVRQQTTYMEVRAERRVRRSGGRGERGGGGGGGGIANVSCYENDDTDVQR